MMIIYKRVIYFIIEIFLLTTFFLGCGSLSNKNDKSKVDVPTGVEAITEITPSEAKVDKDTFIGVDMATIEYASDNRIILHGNFGLFVYDLNSNKIIRGLDVKSIGCGSTQGDNVCIVSVSKDGNIVSLHPSSSEDMFTYNVEKNTLIKVKYKKLDDKLNTIPIDESYKLYDEEYSYSYIKLENGYVSYLRSPKSNKAIDLQYVKDDKIYDIFR
ncbi:MAG: hypothetical protein HUJ77_11395 [Clostridium sp.]|uniref:hypothetical protein n=1 Tax=Clostridium sp. TaxID=1506 RepID=UPI0025BC46EB|nr:hypothetical protein [Clostridium sp.]MCF0148987.1 hypothetical protein [Clostridium sp.]